MSFAPKEQGKLFGDGHFYTWDEDVSHYGDIQASPGQGRGLWVAKIYGLNLAPMLRLLDRDLSNPPGYSPSNECATTVHRYLQLGDGDQFASWWSSHVIGLWSPDDVEDYAHSIVDKTADRGSTYRKYSGAGTVF